MKLTTEELKEGEVYFADFGYNAAVIFRFETHVRTHIYYHSALKKDNVAAERFRVKDYCVLSDSIPLRPATEAEKAMLIKYEAENDVQYFLTDEEKEPKGKDLINALDREVTGLYKEIEKLNRVIKDQKETIEVLEMESMGHDAAMDELKRTIETQALIFADTYAAIQKYRNELLND